MLRPRTGTSCEAKELRLLWDAHYLDAWNGYCRQHSLVSECSSYHILPRIVTLSRGAARPRDRGITAQVCALGTCCALPETGEEESSHLFQAT